VARVVEVAENKPVEMVPQARSVWLCACGLTKNRPFCDGSHKITQSEEPGCLYAYSHEGRALVEVVYVPKSKIESECA